MTTKKYQFYIDNKIQEQFHQVSYKARKLDEFLINKYHKNNSDADRLMAFEEEHLLNTQHPFLKDFVNQNNINENIYHKIVRGYNQVKILQWDCLDIDDLPKLTEITNSQLGLTKQSFTNMKESDYPYIIKILDTNTHNHYTKFTNINENIIVSNFLISHTDLNLRYKIFLNDRLLIERFFPKDLPLKKLLCEECYLDLNTTSKVRIVSNYDLIFKKVTADSNIFKPNSTEFILEP